MPPAHKGVEKYLIVEERKLKVTLDDETNLLAQGNGYILKEMFHIATKTPGATFVFT